MQNIAWRNWNQEAFDEAGQTGKPVLLSIGAAWCHWCHVMESKTFADPRVIEAINKDFIPVRVDTDREPDINTRYNMGGWPSTVFLTAERDVLTGSTYMTPDQMLIVLDRVAVAYGEQIEDLREKAKQARVSTEETFKNTSGGTAKASDVGKVLEILRSSYDPQFGGFGANQKFPHAIALQLLLFSFESTGNEDDLKIVENTLSCMMAGEIFDPVDGGMFRYATNREWTAPHFEKLLSDNALIARVLLDAYRLTENDEYRELATKIFRYMEKHLSDPETGLFHGSQDADERYYGESAEERAKLSAPRVDSALYVDSNAQVAQAYLKLYGIGKELTARDKALRIVGNLNCMPRSEDGCLCHFIDKGVAGGFGVLSDAAQLVLANVVASEATGDESYIRKTQEILEDVFTEFGDESGAFYDVSEARAAERGITRYTTPIEENAAMAVAFVKLADLTQDEAYRLSAKKVLDALAGQFENYGIMGASYGLALGILDSTPLLVTINAEPGTEEADAFIQSSLGVCGQNCTVRTVYRETGEIAASICLGATCRIRVTDPEEVAQALEDLAAERLTV